jgi:hypothetical protein
MFYPSEEHNALVRQAQQLLPYTYDEIKSPARHHPWQISPIWKARPGPSQGHWVAVLEPGMVNGLPAAVKMVVRDLTDEQRERIRREAETAGKAMPPEDAEVDVFLDEQAQLRLNWRRIGTGAAGNLTVVDGELQASFEPVPVFFTNLGVKNAEANPLGFERTPTEGVRYLVASDIVLNQLRVAAQSEVTVGAVVDGTITSVQPTFVVPADRQPRVVSLSKFTPPPPPTLTGADLFFDPFQELPLDQLHLSTIYALSPWNPPSQDVDGNWTIFFQYNLHWNLAHATRIAEAIRVQPLTLFTGLAAGIGDTLFNFILANNNDFAQAAAKLITANNQGGRFHAI